MGEPHGYRVFNDRWGCLLRSNGSRRARPAVQFRCDRLLPAPIFAANRDIVLWSPLNGGRARTESVQVPLLRNDRACASPAQTPDGFSLRRLPHTRPVLLTQRKMIPASRSTTASHESIAAFTQAGMGTVREQQKLIDETRFRSGQHRRLSPSVRMATQKHAARSLSPHGSNCCSESLLVTLRTAT
jgi:hypothetical protein